MITIPWLQDILNKIGKNNDTGSMSSTLFAGQQAIKDTVDGIDITVPTANASANSDMCDVVGNKTDTARNAVATTYSAMGYLKGLTQLLSQLNTGKVAYANIGPTGTFVDAVNISDKGVLTGITIGFNSTDTSTSSVQLKVIIDGTTVLDNFVLQSGGSYSGTLGRNTSLSFFHRFNTSLQIQHLRYGAGVNTIITYTTD